LLLFFFEIISVGCGGGGFLEKVPAGLAARYMKCAQLFVDLNNFGVIIFLKLLVIKGTLQRVITVDFHFFIGIFGYKIVKSELFFLRILKL